MLPQQRPTPDKELGTELPTADNLLDQDQIRRLGMNKEWRVTKTHNNTSGDGINTICQQDRFADPDGLSAVVRSFEAKGKTPRDAVQTVEVSATAEQAQEGFDTTLGWYAGCQLARLQLLDAYKVDNIGDEAGVLTMRVWKKPVTTYSVAVARIGAVTTSTVGRTVGAAAAAARADHPVAGRLGGDALRAERLGGLREAAGVPRGATAALRRGQGHPRGAGPAAGGPHRRALGRHRHPGRAEPVADHVRQGRVRPVGGRGHPRPRLPDPAGEGAEAVRPLRDVRRVRERQAGRRFLEGVRAMVAKCEDRDLATTVSNAGRGKVERSGAVWSTWNLRTEVTERQVVHFRVGFIRVGRHVADLLFVSAPHDDMTTAAFRELVVRAGDRLLELE